MKPAPFHKPVRADRSLTPVLIFKIGAYDLHFGSIGLIRSLGRMGAPIYAVVESRFTPAVFSRYLSGAFVWNNGNLDSAGLLAGMAAIAERIGSRSILMPTDDAAAIFVNENADALRPWFLFPEQLPHMAGQLANKQKLYALCDSIAVPCPRYVTPGSIDELQTFLDDAALPLYVKLSEPWLARQVGACADINSTSMTWSRTKVLAIYEAVQHVSGLSLIVQEGVDPEAGEDWFYSGYVNGQSTGSAGYTGRKIRCYPHRAGPMTFGTSLVNNALRRQAESFLAKVGYRGMVDIDFRLETCTGIYKLLDFNPRLGSQFRLFEDSNGVDLARAAYNDLTGHPAAQADPVHRSLLVEPFDLLNRLYQFRRRELSLLQWWRSGEATTQMAWHSSDDLLPGLIMWPRFAHVEVGNRLGLVRKAKRAAGMPAFVRGRYRQSK